MRRNWMRRTAMLLVATFVFSLAPLQGIAVYAAENETIATNQLTVNGGVVDWLLNGTKPATFGDGTDSGGFDYWDSQPMDFTITHVVDGLTPGTYTMTVKTFGDKGDPLEGSAMFAASGGRTFSTPITYSGSAWGSPRTLTVANVEVGNDGAATLGFTMKAAGGHYGFIDEVRFVRVVQTNKLMVNQAVADWTLGGIKPSTFGDTGYSFNYWNAGPISFSLEHRLTGLQPGIYTMKAKAYGGNAPDEGSVMYAVSGGRTYSTPISYIGSGWPNGASAPTWNTLTVNNIVVGDDGTSTLGFSLVSASEHWGHLTDVTFEPATVGKLKAAPSSISMRPGKTQQITYEVTGTTVTGAVYYESSNPGAAAVNSAGLVTAVAAGNATITVTAATYEGVVIRGQTAILVSEDWQRLGETDIFVKPVPELQDGKRTDFVMGADISTIYEIEQSGRKFYDLEGNEKPLMQILKENGINWVRLRIWNDPKDENGNWYGAGNTDKARVIAMAKQAKEAGLKVLVDFHYSDFWADPGRQTMPKAWAGLDEAALKQAVYDYTYDVVSDLANDNAYPDMVQIGNEINDGMLWPMGRTPAGAKKYIEQGIAAVRIVEAETSGGKIKILIHRANPNNGVDTLTSFYDNYADLDYDVIGLSFYPFWHGSFSNIKEVMNAMAATFNKEVAIAETSYAFTLEDVPNNGSTGQVFSEGLQQAGGYKAGVPGQASAIRDVIAAVAEVPNGKGLGVFYWEPAWLPGVDTGWAAKHAASYQGEAIPEDGGSGWANQAMFNFFGEALPSLQVFDLVRAADDTYVPPAIVEVANIALTANAGVEAPLPATAQVLYADGAYRSVAVESWTPSAYDYNTPGTYTAEGILAGGGTVSATITVRPRNYVSNPGLESSDMSAWILTGAYRSSEAPYTGAYAIHFWNSEFVSAKQTIAQVPAGVYRLSMSSRIGANADPIGESYVYAESDGVRVSSPLIVSGWSAWNLNVVDSIEVRGGTVEIGAVVNRSIEAGGDFDDWELIRVGDLPGGTEPNPGPIVVPGPSEPSNKKVVTNPQANSEGKIAVSISKHEKQVLLPANAAAIDGKSGLIVTREDAEVEIPAEVLTALQALGGTDVEGAQISFRMSELGKDAAENLLGQARSKSKAGLKAAGEVFELELSIVNRDGHSTKLSTFAQPIMLKLQVSGAANPELLGVYYIADDGTLEYVGGTVRDGMMEVGIRHFSKYAVLEYDKTFEDVNSGHWAYDAIKKMTAKHVVTGVSETEYAPARQITRAEFAALLVRALGLTAKDEGSFTDVDRSAWYADAIAAAAEAGIVKGRGANTFAPDDSITRQEMAVMTVNAYEAKTGNRIAGSVKTAFADQAEIDDWAEEAVSVAEELGLLQGRSGGQFAPLEQANRAESALVVFRLMK
jgi:arabinogalactan endo-1,4-beta-galactosidase